MKHYETALLSKIVHAWRRWADVAGGLEEDVTPVATAVAVAADAKRPPTPVFSPRGADEPVPRCVVVRVAVCGIVAVALWHPASAYVASAAVNVSCARCNVHVFRACVQLARRARSRAAPWTGAWTHRPA